MHLTGILQNAAADAVMVSRMCMHKNTFHILLQHESMLIFGVVSLRPLFGLVWQLDEGDSLASASLGTTLQVVLSTGLHSACRVTPYVSSAAHSCAVHHKALCSKACSFCAGGTGQEGLHGGGPHPSRDDDWGACQTPAPRRLATSRTHSFHQRQQTSSPDPLATACLRAPQLQSCP